MMVWQQQYASVFFGGAVGACLRFMLVNTVTRRWGSAFPWGTLSVNLLGCFLAGIIMTVLATRTDPQGMLRALLIVGVIGGFTTFSSWIMECFAFFRATPPALSVAVAYISASFLGGVLLMALGVWIARCMLDR